MTSSQTSDVIRPRVSVITAVHNQCAMNQLFWTYLQKYTKNTFELIVIDNASTDQSASFFESVGAIVIRNPQNYSYPYSQNQGIARARGEYFAFINNDVIVSPDWDQHLIDSMAINGLDAVTACGIERVESATVTKQLKRRWQGIKNILGLLRYPAFEKKILNLMHYWMYRGKWVSFCHQRYIKFTHQVCEGFVGNTVMLTQKLLNLIGPWDERVQAADFDLYLRTKIRSMSDGDIKPLHIALDVYTHHYIRLTSKTKYPPFADQKNLISIEKKWTAQELSLLSKIES